VEQVKIFYEVNNEASLEQRINTWLRQYADTIEITEVNQSQSGRLDRHVVISIFYRERLL
jgi:hypothetical protein